MGPPRRLEERGPVRADRRLVALSALVSCAVLALPPNVHGSDSAAAPSRPQRALVLSEPGVVAGGCAPGSIPDGDGPEAACVPLPESDDGADPPAEAVSNAHRDRDGRWVVYDQIPRRPDRPAEYDAYRFPVSCDRCVTSGYDLDRPDELQRRGHGLREVGHGALDLTAPRGTPVATVTLVHQVGPSELLYAGTLFGNSVVSLHTLREGGALRDYIVLLGHLDAYAANLQPGALLHDGEVLGVVGDSGSPGRIHLHLEVRRVRGDMAGRVELKRLAASDPSALVGSATIVCDPRNVLPLR